MNLERFYQENYTLVFGYLYSLCAEQGMRVSGFEFHSWSEDSLCLWFRYQADDKTGLLEYDLKTKTVQFHVVKTVEIPVAPVGKDA